MAIDPHYIPAFSIEDVLLDKDTGAPLSGGKVYFEQDNQRGTLKPIYQITGTSPNYTYIQLPNPMTLSSIGTFEDSLSNPVIPYYYPYDAELNPEYYYVRVESSEGVEQFTREAQPYIPIQDSPEVLSVITNELSNPQFAEVLFDTSNGDYTYNFSGVFDTVVSIAPDWDLIVSSPSSGTVTVSQITPAGSLNLVTNPGNLLNISSSGLSKLQLRQRIHGSPNLWSSGYLSASFVAKTYTGTEVTLNMYYSQSDGTVVDELIVSASLEASGNYNAYPGSILIPPSTSSDTFPDAYIDIYFDIPLSAEIDISSVMLAFTGDTSIADIEYDQTSFERQIDNLFHYYKPQLEYKPIPSYLVGWDFPLNPCQEFGYLAGVSSKATGASSAYYLADQTILFQTANNNFAMTQDVNGFNITATASSTMALIQYIEGQQAKEILSQRLAVSLKGSATTPSLIGAVSIYWTTNAAVPVLPLSVVTAVNNGANAPTNVVTAGWNEVPRGNMGAARFTLTTETQDFSFNGFDATEEAGIENATFIAVIISFNTIAAAQAISLNYCSLNGGDIATRPGAQSFDQVLQQCQYYYEKSYAKTIAVAANNALNTQIVHLSGQMYYSVFQPAGTINFQFTALHNANFTLRYNTVKRTLAPTVTLYTAGGSVNNVGIVGYNNGSIVVNTVLASSTWTQNGLGDKSVGYLITSPGTELYDNEQSSNNPALIQESFINGYLIFHYVINGRLGEVV